MCAANARKGQLWRQNSESRGSPRSERRWPEQWGRWGLGSGVQLGRKSKQTQGRESSLLPREPRYSRGESRNSLNSQKMRDDNQSLLSRYSCVSELDSHLDDKMQLGSIGYLSRRVELFHQ
ncbi:hypothetical protein CONLIGDRAFT_357467 [Coniochaeta ligniaria NRRL 30616]|uniref:Uncharacterized protein n=1 Tax=Coniochaeta ligniaria NRRL 30616 TaxID=1408157 RepID=A0A1J7JJS7_9PEZI|nr:hypothetical protein CONLIGDRAFT_357467 [Coniochaeta ligniaria NRRL 30616]